MGDPEIDAMGKVLTALSSLDDAEAQARVIKWVSEKLRLQNAAPATTPTAPTVSASSTLPASLRDFADLFDAANPTTDVEKALVAGYWVQVGQNKPDFASQSINDELKQLGHPIANITRALSGLMNSRPSMVQQLRKDGGSQQSRKTYRLTAAGLRKVESMRTGNREGGPE